MKKVYNKNDNHEEALQYLAMYQTGRKDEAWKYLEPYVCKAITVATSRYRLKGWEPEDIKNEMLCVLFKALETAKIDKERGSLFTFLYVTAKRRMAGLCKQERNSRRRILNDALSISGNRKGRCKEDDCSFEDSIPEKPQEKPLETKYLEILNEIELSPLERKCINLWLINMSYEEIAAKTGATIKAVDNSIQRVKNKLRRAGKTEEEQNSNKET